MKKRNLRILLLTIFLASLLIACDKANQRPPVPLDLTSGLESLARAYTSVSSELPIAPTGMNPQAQKKFLIDVFTKANFSYAKTLQSFEQYKATKHSQNIKDLAELLSLPHKNISKQSKVELYTEQELKAINQIDKILN